MNATQDKRLQMPISQASPQRTPTPRHSLRRRKAENERLELIADLWEQVRAEVLQERLQQLSQKVILQRELISAHDRRAQLIKRQEEEATVKKRNEEKKKRQETLAALQDTCRQSLALDRKTKSKPSTNRTRAQSTKEQTVLRDNEDTLEKGTSISRSVHSDSSRHAYITISSPMQEAENECDGDYGDKHENAHDKKVEEIPATSQNTELFKIYEHSAGKYSNASKLLRKKTPHPNLKKLTGHLSASQIWTTLWSDSLSKLLQADERFAKDLKETFSSHVRQGITKFRKPVFRSFTKTQDVPDLESLMDQSKLHQVRVLRHKTQLMHRSSLVNQDRARILLFNNPLPSLSEGDEGIGRFLAPDEDTDSVCTEASYLRWIKDDQCLKKGGNEVSPHTEKKMQASLLSSRSGVNQDLQEIWGSIMARQKSNKEPRYHFLTEKEAKTEGAFMARLSLGKSESMRYPDLMSCQGMSHSRGVSASHVPPAERSRFKSSWEPLSIHALSEYKQQLSAEGRGEFQQGRTAMWSKLPS